MGTSIEAIYIHMYPKMSRNIKADHNYSPVLSYLVFLASLVHTHRMCHLLLSTTEHLVCRCISLSLYHRCILSNICGISGNYLPLHTTHPHTLKFQLCCQRAQKHLYDILCTRFPHCQNNFCSSCCIPYIRWRRRILQGIYKHR